MFICSSQTLHNTVLDTTNFLDKLAIVNKFADNALLVLLDIMSLHTKVPHNEGIDACRYFLQKRNNKHTQQKPLQKSFVISFI